MAKKYGFSMKRATGITSAKRSIARATGIPTTRSGRQQKIGRVMTGGGCLIPLMMTIAAVAAIIAGVL